MSVSNVQQFASTFQELDQMLDCNKSLTVSVHVCILQVIQALSGGVADGAAGHVSVSVQDVGSLLQICTVWYGLDSFFWIFMLVPVKKVADSCWICFFVRARRQEAAVLFSGAAGNELVPKAPADPKPAKKRPQSGVSHRTARLHVDRRLVPWQDKKPNFF